MTLPSGLSNGADTGEDVVRPSSHRNSLLARMNVGSRCNALIQSTFGKLDGGVPKLTPIGTCRSVSLPDIIDSTTVKASPVIKFQPGNKEGENWTQRKERIESALAWVRSELNFIRAQDKVLLSQLQQCQDNIERLKRQRQQAAEQHEVQSFDDDSYWEDWEISEFDMEDKKNFGQQILNSKRFAHSNPEISKSLLATYNGNNGSTIKKDLEIRV